jgi:hypothetical protein
MPQFKKKPVVIEAVRFIEIANGKPVFDVTGGERPDWLDAALTGASGHPGSIWTDGVPGKTGTVDATESDPFGQGPNILGLKIGTLEGEHIASEGDWIIRGVKGELYPCKPDIFAATYDPVFTDTADAANIMSGVGERYADAANEAKGRNIPDYASMSPGDMLSAMGTDAMAWADAWSQVACMNNPLGRELRAFPHGDRGPLHGTMLGWFANAIEAGRAAGYAAARPLDPGFVYIDWPKPEPAFDGQGALPPRPTRIDAAGEYVRDASLDAEFMKGAGDNAHLVADPDLRTHGEHSAVDDGDGDAERGNVVAPGRTIRINPDDAIRMPNIGASAAASWQMQQEASVALAVLAIVREFIAEQRIEFAEQTVDDRVYENAPGFIEKLANVAGYAKSEED